jgi:hypothetical protein
MQNLNKDKSNQIKYQKINYQKQYLPLINLEN